MVTDKALAELASKIAAGGWLGDITEAERDLIITALCSYSPDSEPFDPFGVALILKDQTAELERLRQDCAWKACIISACDTEMERLRGLLREAGIDPALSSG